MGTLGSESSRPGPFVVPQMIWQHITYISIQNDVSYCPPLHCDVVNIVRTLTTYKDGLCQLYKLAYSARVLIHEH
jgi:hypothetical protein